MNQLWTFSFLTGTELASMQIGEYFCTIRKDLIALRHNLPLGHVLTAGFVAAAGSS